MRVHWFLVQVPSVLTKNHHLTESQHEANVIQQISETTANLKSLTKSHMNKRYGEREERGCKPPY